MRTERFEKKPRNRHEMARYWRRLRNGAFGKEDSTVQEMCTTGSTN